MRSTALALVLLSLLAAPLAAQDVSRIEISPERVEAMLGDTVPLSATVYGADGDVIDAPVRWLTSYEVGTIGADGAFHAAAVGEQAIIAAAGDVTASIPVVVEPAPPTRVEPTLPTPSITATSWLPLSAEAYDAAGRRVFDVDVAWTSSDPAVAEVVGDLLVGRSAGTAIVEAAVGESVGAVEVTVTPSPSGELAAVAPGGPIRTGDVHALAPTLGGAALPDGAFPRYAVTGPDARVWPDGAFVAEEPGHYVVSVEYAGATATIPIEVEPRTFDRRLEHVGRGPISTVNAGDLWVFDDAVYIGNYGGTALRVFDVSDPANPVLTDSIVVDARRVNDVKVNPEAGYAIMTREGASDRRNGFVVLDVADPHHPTVVSEYTETVSGGVHNTFLVGELVYTIHNGTSDLHIVDVSDRENPVEVGRWGLDQPNKVLHDVFVKDGIAYLSYWDHGLVILDLGGAGRGGTPTEPAFVSRVWYPEGNTHVAWRWRDYVFVGDEFFPADWSPDEAFAPSGFVHVFDVSDLENPVEVATYEVPEAGAHNLWIEDDEETLYIGYYNAGLRALDVGGELRGDLYDQGRQIDFARTMADEDVKVPNAPMNWGAMIHDGLIFSSDFNSGLWIHRWVPVGSRPIS